VTADEQIDIVVQKGLDGIAMQSIDSIVFHERMRACLRSDHQARAKEGAVSQGRMKQVAINHTYMVVNQLAPDASVYGPHSTQQCFLLPLCLDWQASGKRSPRASVVAISSAM